MKPILVLIYILFLSATVLQSQPIAKGAGTSANMFLRSELSARVSGQAGAFTAVAGDENALFYNPAGLAAFKNGSAAFNHNEWFDDIRMDNLLLAYRVHKKFSLAASFSHLWMPSIQGRDKNGQKTQMLDVSSSILQVGLGYRLVPSVFAGVALKLFRDNLAGYSAKGAALDAGLFMYTRIPGLSAGIAVQNLGPDIRYDRVRETIPFSYSLGLAYKVPHRSIRFALDARKANDSDWYLKSGIEYIYSGIVSLRLGNSLRNEKLLQPSFGAGIKIRRQYIIDYAFANYSDLGATHRIGFSFIFKKRLKKADGGLY